MVDLVETIVALGFGVTSVAWVLVHGTFLRLLRKERPDLADECRGFDGMQPRWVDFALRRGYRGTGSEALDHAGDRLVAWNNHLQGAFALFLVAGAFFFAFDLLFSSG
jgi:hypothetical protein